MEDRLKEAAEQANKETASKDVAEVTAKEKITATEISEERAQVAKRAEEQAEQQRAEAENKLGEAELRVAGAENIISARDNEFVELKAAPKEGENKWYNMGFNDAKNSAEPVMFESQKYGFGKGWMATVLAMGVPEDSPLRNPDQIPYLEPPPTQNPIEVEEEDTPSMRELVQAIDSH